MANRTITYGYKIENGILSIEPHEALVVKEVFTSYVNGTILNDIAKKLTQRCEIYFCERAVWSKNMIDRIISNRRYLALANTRQSLIQSCSIKPTPLKQAKEKCLQLYQKNYVLLQIKLSVQNAGDDTIGNQVGEHARSGFAATGAKQTYMFQTKSSCKE